jgi:hypothetical protein
MTPDNVVPVGDGFWNIRGKFKIGGLVDVGTQSSLVRRRSGSYVLLDACALDSETKRWVDEETSGGAGIEAVLHLHPFHTVSVRPLHELYPKAKLYGTARHKRLAPELPWEAETTDDTALHERFADDLTFSVPRGVDFIPTNENLHFSSVLAFHAASHTLHVDDTLCYVRLPRLLRPLKKDFFGFHPSLAKVLEHRPGAAKDFREWTGELVERARSIENLCAAHSTVLATKKHGGPSIADRIEQAARGLEPKLDAHERRWG